MAVGRDGSSDRVPELRVRAANDAPLRPERGYVLYWMTAYRRTDHNFALQRAVERARSLDRPLLVLEALRTGYRWASRRTHVFAVQGMADNWKRLRSTRTLYYPYLEPSAGAGRGLLAALAADACVVVGDDHPGFFLPRMAEAAARQLAVRLELVDGNGLLPLRAAGRPFARAHDFRRFLHGELPRHLERFPRAHPLTGDPLPEPPELPRRVLERWPPAPPDRLEDPASTARDLPVAGEPTPVPHAGGPRAGGRVLRRFVEERIDRYAGESREPAGRATSGLSPYLHFGHVSTHAVFAAVAERQGWEPSALGEPTGKRSGWWGMDENAEAFLDQLVTWRELGFLAAAYEEGYDTFASLPDWAHTTLAEHADDPRDPLYAPERLEVADTHDPVWNAAQNQLREEGRIHNYMRMLWGKKILQWTESPERAYELMVELNNRYGVDGRDPNSYSGILWVLGKYDRAWGPERPIFGKVRYMTSESAERKLELGPYLERWTSSSPGGS